MTRFGGVTMDRDDAVVGRVITRREMLALLGASGAAAVVAGCTKSIGAGVGPIDNTGALPSCVVRPQQTIGPYFVNEQLNRSDIRSDPASGAVKPGARLDLTFNLSRVGSACAPLSGAQIHLWQCDAAGVYSDVAANNSLGQQFLRGYQITDGNGQAKFTTIYPGWYAGRTVHIHAMIRTDPATEQGYEFVSQLYFDDALTDQVHASAPYASRGSRPVRNTGDPIFQSGGTQLLLATLPTPQGYAAVFNVGLLVA